MRCYTRYRLSLILVSVESNWLTVVSEKEMNALTTSLEEVRKHIPSQSELISTINKGLMLSQKSTCPPSSQEYSRQLIPNEVDIYVMCSEENTKYCQLFCRLLIHQNQSLIIKKSFEETNSSRLAYLETARLVIPLLSPSFMLSIELVHELNIAWCRQRYSDELCFLVIILESLPVKPTYVHLLPCFFNCKDRRWKESSEIKEIPSCLEDLVTECNIREEVILCIQFAIKWALSWMTGKDFSIWGLHNKFSNCFHLSNCLQQFTKS